MSWQHQLMVLSACISLFSISIYLKSMIRGEAKPNLVSWGMWAAAPLVGASAAIAAGADWWATARIVMTGLMPLVVFLFGLFYSQSYWKLSRFDAICGVCSCTALCVWLFVANPVLAVLIAAVGDGAATLPTVLKTWKHPETESGQSFLVGFLGGLLSIPSIPEYTIVNTAFQTYLFCAGLALVVAAYRKKITLRLWGV